MYRFSDVAELNTILTPLIKSNLISSKGKWCGFLFKLAVRLEIPVISTLIKTGGSL